MEITTLCAIVAALKVIPNRSQFFNYEPIALSCVGPGNSNEWRVKRNTSTNSDEECSKTWGKRNKSYCYVDDLYPLDTGVYWCEFGAGGCSNAVNITVTLGSVILESPVLPVQEGDSVTLRCTVGTTSSANLTAEFYKDDLLVGSSSTGAMTIHNVSKSDEGFYRCNITGGGGSPGSWLAVRAGHAESSRPPLTCVLLPVLSACLLLALVMFLYLWRRHKGKTDPDVSYADITITQKVHLKRDTEMNTEPTIYSTIKPEAT
ncbi:low affinity immunoglobulin gamma Fc region receptor II-like isoform X2 [Trachinotus anak]|uniref:low affinity immunoglobulin gamma Fc region receptor II-like isoform X2 n=1 Tax=Trachinotus anak TaxID=443729 RepID=UPI0039F1D8EF